MDYYPFVFHPNLFKPILRPDDQKLIGNNRSQDLQWFSDFSLEEEKGEEGGKIRGFGTPF